MSAENAPLYQQANDMAAALDELDRYCAQDPEDPVLEDELLKRWADVELKFDEKVERTGLAVMTASRHEDMVRAEIQRLEGKLRAIERKEQWLKSYLFQSLLAAGIKKVEGTLCKVGRRNNPASVKTRNPLLDTEPKKAGVPEQFLRHVPERWELDKRAILEHYKTTGEIVCPDDLDIVQTEHLRVW